jgi:hypothetical protein
MGQSSVKANGVPGAAEIASSGLQQKAGLEIIFWLQAENLSV